MTTTKTNELFLKGTTDFFGKPEYTTVEYSESFWQDGFAVFIQIKSENRKTWTCCANHGSDEEPHDVFLNAIAALDESDENKEMLRELTNFALNMMDAYKEEGECTAKDSCCANFPKFRARFMLDTVTEFCSDEEEE